MISDNLSMKFIISKLFSARHSVETFSFNVKRLTS